MANRKFVVRKIDSLYRIKIPDEIVKKLELEKGDACSIEQYGEKIVITKYRPHCIFCGNDKGVINYNEQNVCEACIKKMQKNISQVETTAD